MFRIRLRYIKVIGILSLIFCSLTAYAQDAVDFDIDQFVLRLTEVAGPEVGQEIGDFRRDVEKIAFKETLKLCEGYRQMAGYGPVEGHEFTGEFSPANSMLAWVRVAQAGLFHPIDSTFGLKATYLNATSSNFWAFQTFFGSLYTAFLVRSFGFLEGASHCLNTVSAREINNFAAAIVAVDYESTLAGEVAMTWGSGEVLSIVARYTTWVLRPLANLTRIMRLRLSATHIALAKFSILSVSADNLFRIMQHSEEMQAASNNVTAQLDDPNSPLEMAKRWQLAAHAIQSLKTDVTNRDKEYSVFLQDVRENFPKPVRQKFDKDLVYLHIRNALTPEEEKYKIVLETLLPILAQVPETKS